MNMFTIVIGRWSAPGPSEAPLRRFSLASAPSASDYIARRAAAGVTRLLQLTITQPAYHSRVIHGTASREESVAVSLPRAH